MVVRAVVHNERGIAMIMALMIIMVLVVIVLAITQMTTGELEIHRLSRSDTRTQYLAQAGVEHQIYRFKEDRNAAAIAYTNYPVLAGETPGFGALWYRTTRTCTLNCTGTPALRRWTIDSFGEIRNYDPISATFTTVQQRTVRVQVEIAYSGSSPTAVTLLRWEEVYP
jgi:Tfp pilus assembly protein PilX